MWSYGHFWPCGVEYLTFWLVFFRTSGFGLQTFLKLINLFLPDEAKWLKLSSYVIVAKISVT